MNNSWAKKTKYKVDIPFIHPSQNTCVSVHARFNARKKQIWEEQESHIDEGSFASHWDYPTAAAGNTHAAHEQEPTDRRYKASRRAIRPIRDQLAQKEKKNKEDCIKSFNPVGIKEGRAWCQHTLACSFAQVLKVLTITSQRMRHPKFALHQIIFYILSSWLAS